MSSFKFYIYDGDGYVNEWYGSSSQKVINGVVSARTGIEVAEAIVRDFYVTQKGSFTPLTSKWDITNIGSEVIFTSKLEKAYEKFQIVIPEKDNSAEIKGEFLQKQTGGEGYAGIKQVNTLKITGAVNKAGKLVVTFEEGIEKIEKTIVITKDETHASIASKIVKEFRGLSGWDVTNSEGSADVVFTSKTANADKDLKITLSNN